MKKGFSVAELLIAITIIGVMSALTMSVLTSNTSMTTKAQYKSAFNSVSQVVTEIIANTTAFPVATLTNNSTVSIGNNGSLANAFCTNFYNTINTVVSTTSCNSTAGTSTDASPNFVTSNGMKWFGLEGDFVPADGTGNKTIWVDLDGKGTNIFPINIYATGKLDTSGNATATGFLTN